MKKGFSLVELLVSLVIISIIVVFISSFVLGLRDERGSIIIDVPSYVTQASISRTLNYDVIEHGGISTISITDSGKTCTITYGNGKTGVVQISADNKTLTYTYDSATELIRTLNGNKTFTSIEESIGFPKTYGNKKLYKYVIHVSDGNDIEVVNYSNGVPNSITMLPGTDSETGFPVVKIGTEEFYVISDVAHAGINYNSFSSTFRNLINYDSSKTVLLAKYSLYVGRNCTGSSSCTIINKTDSGYGLQSVNVKGSKTSPALGVVPFCGSSSMSGYWQNGKNKILSKYGTYTDYANNIYDTNYITAPNYSAAFWHNTSNVNNVNYSIAYYVEEYVSKLGIEATGRLLTYPEANAMTATQRDNGADYWLGSAAGNAGSEDGYVWESSSEETGGSHMIPEELWLHDRNTIRPVIVVNTSDIH